jgi:hypothetical protein
MDFAKNGLDAVAFLAALSDAKQAHFLVRFSFELTIAGRATYEVGGMGVDQPARLRELNETLHRALGQSDKCLRGITPRYSAEDMVGILLNHQSEFLTSAAQHAFDRSREAVGQDP